MLCLGTIIIFCSLLLPFPQDDHRSFRRQLEAKRPIIETNLISGRQHVANEPPVSEASDSEGKPKLYYHYFVD